MTLILKKFSSVYHLYPCGVNYYDMACMIKLHVYALHVDLWNKAFKSCYTIANIWTLSTNEHIYQACMSLESLRVVHMYCNDYAMNKDVAEHIRSNLSHGYGH